MPARKDKAHRRSFVHHNGNRFHQLVDSFSFYEAPVKQHQWRARALPYKARFGDDVVVNSISDHPDVLVEAWAVFIQQLALALSKGDDAISAADHRFLSDPLREAFPRTLSKLIFGTIQGVDGVNERLAKASAELLRDRPEPERMQM